MSPRANSVRPAPTTPVSCGRGDEREVRDLSEFTEFDAAEWDRQLEEDVASGKLDRLADAALADHSAGHSRTL
jgi:hypothetical protein